MSEAAETCLI